MINIPREYHDHEDLGLNSSQVDAILVALDGSSVFEFTWRVIVLLGNDVITDISTYTSLVSKGYIIYGDLADFGIKCIQANNEYMDSPLGNPNPSLVLTEYFQVDFTTAVGKTLELTSIEFDVANRIGSRLVGNLALAYSLNSDFSDSIVLIDADISDTSVSFPLAVNQSFSSQVILEEGETIYFRIYPYNAFNSTQPQMVIGVNTFFVNGVVDGNIVHSIKCIGVNKEYLTSPANNYFNSFNGLDINVSYSSAEDSIIFISQDFDVSNSLYFFKNSTSLVFAVLNAGVEETVEYLWSGEDHSNGTVEVRGVGSDVSIYFNGALLATETLTIGYPSIINGATLVFNQPIFAGLGFDIIFDYIKINNHEWFFLENTGPTTTNSQGVITTLVTNENSEDMWFTHPILSWPLDDNVNDSYDFFVFDTDNIQDANYTLAGIIDDVGSPISSGGLWRFMPSSAYEYFGTSIDGLDIEIEYEGGAELSIAQGDASSIADIQVSAVGVALSLHLTTELYFHSMPSSGLIKLIGTGNDVEIFVDGNSIGVKTFTTISINIAQFPLYFNATYLGVPFGNSIYRRVKINNHEWTFSEGTGSMTINNQGVITNLNSSVATEPMWVIES